MNIKIQTPRLILRQWQDSDTAPFIQMCADDNVMRYFLKKLNADEAIAFMQRLKDAIEIGWRLLPQYWNQGYATEGAKAVLKYAFRTLRLEKVISFTACVNTPSERVMQNIGLEKVGEFDHPLVPADHILCRHVLYEKQRSDYLYIPFC